MPKLKTYVTQTGFFELAVAVPSMKAAIEALGIPMQSFKKGFASETAEKAVVAATGAKPGLVLKRAVGSKGKFLEHAALPVIKVGKTARKEVDTKTDRRTTTAKSRQDALARKRIEANRKRDLVKFMRARIHHDDVLAKLDQEAAGLARSRALEEDRWAKVKQSQSKP